jgi:hypothetical protein
MWTIESTPKGYSLFKDGQPKAELYGMFQDWKPVIDLLNSPEAKISPEQEAKSFLYTECPNCSHLFETSHLADRILFGRVELGACPSCHAFIFMQLFSRTPEE